MTIAEWTIAAGKDSGPADIARKSRKASGNMPDMSDQPASAATPRVIPDTSMAYRTTTGEARLVTSVVAFLDLLGFRRASEEAEPEAALRALRLALDHAAVHARDSMSAAITPELGIPPRWATRVFTDNFVLVYPIWRHSTIPRSLCAVLWNLSWFQTEMTRRGFPVRGAIAVGPAYVDEDIVFGPAVTEAYTGEQRAISPRIILCSSAAGPLLDDLQHYSVIQHSPQWQHLRRDSNQTLFLDYLNDPVHVAVDELGPDMLVLSDERAVIEAGLARVENDAHTRAKYEWLARYHNRFCQRFQYPETHEVPGLPPGEDIGLGEN